MSLGKYILLIAIACILVVPVCNAANIRGVIYDHSYNPIQKVIVTINTTPEQTKISTTGAYYFTVSAGTYHIAATLTKNNISKVIATQDITVAESDDVMRDLLLADNIDLETAFAETWWNQTQNYIRDHVEIFILILLILAIAFAVVYAISFYRRKIKKIGSATPVVIPDGLLTDQGSMTAEVADVNIELVHPADQNVPPTPAAVVLAPSPVILENRSNDEIMQDKIVQLISNANGTLAQKDLKKEFAVSEAKISTVVSDMETKGLLKKTRKGRTNYLQLVSIVKKA